MQNINSTDKDVGHRFNVLYENRPGYLFAKIDGPQDSLEISLAYWRELAMECQRRNAKRLLVVDQLQGEPLGLKAIEALIIGWIGTGLELIQMAFVELDSVNVAFMEHGQIFATEKGFTARVFTEFDEAERWLRYGS
jgi:hypothetical protein